MNNFRIAAMKVVKNQFNSPNSKVPNICNELSHQKNYKNFNILNNGFNFTNSHLDFQNNKLKQMQKIAPTDRQQTIHQSRAPFTNQLQQNRKNICGKTFQNRQLADSSKVSIAPLDRAQKHQISHKGLQSAQPGHSTFSPYNCNDVIQNQNSYIRNHGNKIILNPKNNFGNHLYCSTKNLASQDLCNSRQLNKLQMKNNMSCAQTQSTVDRQIFHHKKSQNSELNSPKQLRQKKTVFRAPTFLKCKDSVQSNENKAKIRSRASSSHNSMPKNFKAPELICHARDSAIHKFIQQKQNNKKISNRDRRSSMEKKIKNSLSEGQSKFYTFDSRDMKIQSYPRILQIGKQVNLKVFSKQNQNLRACLKVVKLLAENGPNSVYLVVQNKTGFLYCLKKSQVKPSQQSKQKMSENQQFPNMLSYLIRQSKIGMTLQHPLLVKTYCTLYDNKNIYQLMQYIQGSSLLSQLNPHKKSLQSSSIPVNPPSKICQILCQLLESLMYLHSRKIAHRDLKPANIFITNSQIYKIGDFGCSLPIRNGEIVEDFVGTLDYVAPQVLHHEQHGLPVDLWAIGCIAYQLWNGRPPFYHIKRARTIDNIVECRVNLQKIQNKVFKDFVYRLLVKQPQNRMTAKQAYNHPLLQQYRNYHNKINSEQKHYERQQQHN